MTLARSTRCRVLATTALLVGLVAFAPLRAEPPVGAEASSRVDEVFAPFTVPGSPGCAVSVTHKGAVVHASGYGLARVEAGVPITPRSVFQVASVSKQFTALATQLLVDEGRLSWDDDVREYVPELEGLTARITLRQLAHHTSGLRDQWSLLQLAGWRLETDVVSQTDVLDLLARQRRLNFSPGSGFLYSNSGYTLLAIVVERVSGEPFRRFTARRIFEPLGMTSTHFRDEPGAVARNRADAYAADAEGGYRLAVPRFASVGATNLFTTLEDLARWERNFQTGQVGGRAGLALLQEPGTLRDGRLSRYGLGLVLGRYRGALVVGHNGTAGGYQSEVLRFPEQGLGVAVLCNVRSADPAELARSVADVYLTEAAPSDRSSRARPRRSEANGDVSAVDLELTDLTGYYRRAESDVPLYFVVRDGVLATEGVLRAMTLAPIDDAREGTDGRFQVSGSLGSTATFRPAADAVRLELRQGGLDPAVVYERSSAWQPTPQELETYVGRYRSAELATDYEIGLANGRLLLSHPTLGTTRLAPTYRDGFRGGGVYLSLIRDTSGRVTGLTASTERAWKIAFDRRPLEAAPVNR